MKYTKGVIKGMIIGDGYVRKNQLTIQHSLAQEEYLIYKAKRLEMLLNKSINVFHKEFNGYFAKVFCVSHQIIGFVQKQIYKDGKKHITKEILHTIPDEGIAYWYLDDGSLYTKKNSKGIELVISTYFETENEALDVISFFKERYGCIFTVKRNKNRFSIRCGKTSAIILLSKLLPYIPQCMYYKTFEKRTLPEMVKI